MKTANNFRWYISPDCKIVELNTKAYCIVAGSDTKGIGDGTVIIEDWGTPIEG